MANGEFGGGIGTREDPYLVEDAMDLDAVREDMKSHYLQVADIDLGSWGNWVPIGGSGSNSASGSSVTFDGYYNGGGYQVRNMTCEHPSKSFVGLFGRVSSGKLFNIGVVSQVTVGGSSVGGISGSGAGISDCYSTGRISSGGSAGGISGGGGSHTNCYSTCNVTGGSSVGGISGGGGGHVNCYSAGNVTGESSVGGISGALGRNKYCYSAGNIVGLDLVGGISGGDSKNEDCYALNPTISLTHDAKPNARIGDIGGIFANTNVNCYSIDTLEFRKL